MSDLSEIADSLWVAEHPLRVWGLAIGTRMTVVKLRDGRLWLHSPIPRSAPLVAALEKLGPVGFVIAPNKLHHFYVGEWAHENPEATLYGAPGLREKRRDVVFHRELEDAAPSDWQADLDQVWFRGSSYVNEVVFLHRPSRSAIFTDLLMNPDLARMPWRTRAWFRTMGLGQRAGSSRLIRTITRNRVAGREAIDRILAWDFDRAILAHGEVVESDAHEAVRQAFDWLESR